MGLQVSAGFMGASSFHNQIETDRKILESRISQWVTWPRFLEVGDFAVSPGPGHNVLVGAGMAYLPPKGLAVGTYFAYSDGNDTVSLHAATTLPFIDTVILRVADDQYGTVTGTKGARYDVIQGTPNASPVAPSDATIDALAVPGTWVRLCDVRVNVADTGVVPGGQFSTPTNFRYVGAPNCRLQGSGSAQALTTGTTQTIAMDTTIFDYDGMADLANEWIIINSPGVYMFGGTLAFASNATGYRAASLLAGASGGGQIIGTNFVPAISGQRTVLPVMGMHRLAVGEVIRLRGLHNVGANLNTDITDNTPFLWATWVHP